MKNLDPAYVHGVESGKKFILYANKYGLLDARTMYWSMCPLVFSSHDEKLFYRGFFIALK